MRERITIAVIGLFCILAIAAWTYTRFDTPVEERKTTAPPVVNAGYRDYSEEEKEEAYDKGYDYGYEEGYSDGISEGAANVQWYDDEHYYEIYAEAYYEGYNDCANGVAPQY